MPDDKINTLIEAVSTLTKVVTQIAQSAKPEHLNFLEKDLIQQSLSGVNSSLEKLRSGKLDDPSLS